MKFSSAIIFSTLFLLVAGCQKKEAPKRDVILTAYQLIDLNKVDEAIVLLEKEIKSSPEHQKAKTVLASAYALKAGVSIQKIFGSYLNYLRIYRSDDLFRTKNDDAMTLEKFSKNLVRTLNIFDSIPAVNSAQFDYLQEAISIHEGADQSQLSRADFLYRSILRIIEFKSWLYLELQNKTFIVDSTQCKLDYDQLNSFINDISAKLLALIQDLVNAEPDNKARYLKIAESIIDLQSNLTSQIDSNTIDSSQGLELLRSLMLQNGLEAFVRCSPGARN